jgi:AraC family transcriptional regulator of adaptative response/methylated-DNA-[protein]-cysteine methyltransferase
MFTDGPLRRRPPEEIRYGTGRCALGHVLVASSDKGIVSIVVRGSKAPLEAELRERFPKAELVRDEKGCSRTVARVLNYIAAPFKPFPLPLDLRGTELQKRVWEEVRRIPFGSTSSYTKVAEAIGAPRAIRAVASSCARCMHAFAVPCHRVLQKGGGATDANGRRRLAWVKYEQKLARSR